VRKLTYIKYNNHQLKVVVANKAHYDCDDDNQVNDLDEWGDIEEDDDNCDDE
jgi:hypothetical protein